MAITRVDPWVGGFGIDITDKLTLESNATLTVGNGTSTGNVNVGNSVGICTTEPAYNLDVNGTFNTTSFYIGGTQVTATASELNILDGVTATASELNILDGVTATAAELNILDGVTATTTEINYVDGVTSNIQTQLNARLPLSGGTMTGVIAGFESTGIDDSASSTAVTIDSSGRVGIGTSSPASRLTVSDGSSGLTPFSDTDVFMDSSGDNYLQFGSGSSSSPAIYFGDSADGDAGGIIYSHATDAMSFRANAAERMRIDSSGNVGIGTSSPAEKLEVTGNLMLDETDADIKIKSGGVGTTGAVRWTFNTDSTSYGDISLPYDTRATVGLLLRSTNGYPITIDGGNGVIFKEDSTTETMRIDSSGRVGIGTSSPGEKLNVSTGGSEYAIQWNSTGSNNWVLASASNRAYIVNKSTPLEVLSILNGGNVGIGTNSPGTKLNIYTGSATNTFTRVQNTLGYIDIGPTSGGGIYGGYAAPAAATNYLLGTSNSNPVLIYTNGSERMRIDSSGLVGIGTSSPSAALDVNGTQLALSGAGTDNRHIEIGVGRTGNGYSYIDLIGDTTYSDYGLRLIRANGGPNTSSELTHRGTGPLVITAFDAGYVELRTANTERMRITSSGLVGIGTSSPVVLLDIGPTDGADEGAEVKLRGATNGTVDWGTDVYISDYRIFTTAKGSAASFTERMRITSSGNVGIGTSAPTEKLSIATDTDVSAEIGKAHVGYVGHADYAGFSHIDQNVATGYALLQAPGGTTYLNTPTGGSIRFRIANADKMVMDSSGDVNVVTGKLQEGGNDLIPAGSIIMYGAASAPSGWLLCEGAAVSRTTYATLFAVISTTYGSGDGSTTFNVPDFRDRAPYGASTFLLGSTTAGEVNVNGQNSTGTGTSGSTGGSTVADTTGSGGPTTHTVTTNTTNSTTDKDVTNAITVVTAVSDHAAHTHSIPSLTVNGHTHSVPALTVTHPGVAVKFIIKT